MPLSSKALFFVQEKEEADKSDKEADKEAAPTEIEELTADVKYLYKKKKEYSHRLRKEPMWNV